MLSPTTRSVANHYWAADIGCSPSQSAHSNLLIAPPPDPTFTGLFAFVQDLLMKVADERKKPSSRITTHTNAKGQLFTEP